MNTKKMTKAEALEFRERWRIANQRIREEMLATPPAIKLKQLAALYVAVKAFGWDQKLREGEEIVWERWRRLREKYV